MLFDLGWSEILLIGTVALIFIGPKDLPKALRVAGFWVRKARTLSREFQSSIDQIIREAELDEMRQDLKKATEFDLEKEFHNTIDPTGSLRESLKVPELPSFSGTEGSPTPTTDSGARASTTVAAEMPTPLETAPGNAADAVTALAEPAATEPRISEPPPAAKAPPDDIALDIVPPRP
jgi:sec-independent protein translocase protein TatB